MGCFLRVCRLLLLSYWLLCCLTRDRMAPSGPSYDRAPLASGLAAYQALGWFGRHFHLGRLGPVVTCQRSVLQVLQAQMSELNKLPLVILSASLGLEAAARVEAPDVPTCSRGSRRSPSVLTGVKVGLGPQSLRLQMFNRPPVPVNRL